MYQVFPPLSPRKTTKKKADKVASMPETADYSLARNPDFLEAPLALIWTCPHCGNFDTHRDNVSKCGCSDQVVLCFHHTLHISKKGYVARGIVVSDEELAAHIKKLEELPKFPNSDGSIA